jgi:hypothetical protein
LLVYSLHDLERSSLPKPTRGLCREIFCVARPRIHFMAQQCPRSSCAYAQSCSARSSNARIRDSESRTGHVRSVLGQREQIQRVQARASVIRKAQRCAQGEMMPETCGMIRDDLALIINLIVRCMGRLFEKRTRYLRLVYHLFLFFCLRKSDRDEAAFEREGAEGRQRGDKAIPGADTRAAAARTQSVSCKCVH